MKEAGRLWRRRDVLSQGLGGAVILGAAMAGHQHWRDRRSSLRPIRIPPLTETAPSALTNSFNPLQILRDFDYGLVKQEGGRTVREFRLVANSTPLQLNSVLSHVGWAINGRVPGPTLRATEGDRVRIIFHNQDGHAHSLHFHGIHPAAMDGVQAIRHDRTAIYEFDTHPYGLYPYHCHVSPVTRHISKGLYGLLIVDPKAGRSPADELVMVMGGYDLDTNQRNDIYAFNGLPNYYRDHPIQIYQNQRIRLYLMNMVEFDPALTFHLHANLFQVYRMGRSLQPDEETDVITMGTAERHILEFTYPYPGRYMFHPHQDELAENGCMGVFDVLPAA